MSENGNFWTTASIACALAGLAVAIVQSSQKKCKWKNIKNQNLRKTKSNLSFSRVSLKSKYFETFQKTSFKTSPLQIPNDQTSNNLESSTDCLNDFDSVVETVVKKKEIFKGDNNKRLQCSYCEQKFKTRLYLRKHEENHQNRNCCYCGKFFKQPIRLKNHLRTHTGEKPFQCSECPAVFALKSNLKTHFIYKHTDDRPFECNYEGCGKYFKTEQLRNNHEKRHNKNVEFQCEICGMEFNVRAKLRMHHKKKHMDYNQRPHHCRFCDKKFVEKDQFREHERTHTGEKPLKCNQCSSSFAKKSSLREHKKLHSGEKKHVCKICGKAFAQSAGYWNHMRNHP